MPSSSGIWSTMFSNAAHESEHAPRILMVRLGAMGDVIQTLPAAADLRARFPKATIAWAVDSLWTPLLKGNADLDEVIPVPLRQWRRSKSSSETWTAAARFVRDLRGRAFDIAIDFQGLLKSAGLATIAGAARRLGFSPNLLREPSAGILYDWRMDTPERHVVDRYRSLACEGGGPPVGAARFRLPTGTAGSRLPERFVIASPMAGWGLKQWPTRHYMALAARIWREARIPLVADCAPGRRDYVEEIRDGAPQGAVIVHPSTIPQLISATRRATAAVGVDSGPLHLAAALGRPGVAVFGPTDPQRNGPYGHTIAVVRDQHAATSYKRHPEPDSSMWNCGPDLVFEHLRQHLR